MTGEGSDARYDLVLSGQLQPDRELADVVRILAKATRSSLEAIERLLAKGEVVVKRNLDAKGAKRYEQVFTAAGVVCRLVPRGQGPAARAKEGGKQPAPTTTAEGEAAFLAWIARRTKPSQQPQIRAHVAAFLAETGAGKLTPAVIDVVLSRQPSGSGANVDLMHQVAYAMLEFEGMHPTAWRSKGAAPAPAQPAPPREPAPAAAPSFAEPATPSGASMDTPAPSPAPAFAPFDDRVAEVTIALSDTPVPALPSMDAAAAADPFATLDVPSLQDGFDSPGPAGGVSGEPFAPVGGPPLEPNFGAPLETNFGPPPSAPSTPQNFGPPRGTPPPEPTFRSPPDTPPPGTRPEAAPASGHNAGLALGPNFGSPPDTPPPGTRSPAAPPSSQNFGPPPGAPPPGPPGAPAVSDPFGLNAPEQGQFGGPGQPAPAPEQPAGSAVGDPFGPPAAEPADQFGPPLAESGPVDLFGPPPAAPAGQPSSGGSRDPFAGPPAPPADADLTPEVPVPFAGQAAKPVQPNAAPVRSGGFGEEAPSLAVGRSGGAPDPSKSPIELLKAHISERVTCTAQRSKASPKIPDCVTVMSIAPFSPAAGFGIRPGDLVSRINDRPASSGSRVALAGVTQCTIHSKARGDLEISAPNQIGLGVRVRRPATAIMREYKGEPEAWIELWAQHEFELVRQLCGTKVKGLFKSKKTPAVVMHGAALYELGYRDEGIAIVTEYLQEQASLWGPEYGAVALLYVALHQYAQGQDGLENLVRAYAAMPLPRIAAEIQRVTGQWPPKSNHRLLGREFPLQYELPRCGKAGMTSLRGSIGQMRPGQMMLVCLMGHERTSSLYVDWMDRYCRYYDSFFPFVAGMHVITDHAQAQGRETALDGDAAFSNTPWELLSDRQGKVGDAVGVFGVPVLFAVDRGGIVRWQGPPATCADVWEALVEVARAAG